MKSKNLTVFLNRRQVAVELGETNAKVYRAFEQGLLQPDALDLKGGALVRAARLQAIRRTLAQVEVIA